VHEWQVVQIRLNDNISKLPLGCKIMTIRQALNHTSTVSANGQLIDLHSRNEIDEPIVHTDKIQHNEINVVVQHNYLLDN
jgi:hypothetical protein